jgi:hypothetical protein
MNQWTKRPVTSLLCPSGATATVRRPGPDLLLKAGKIARILGKQEAAGSDIDKQLTFLEELPDDELIKLMAFARVVLTDSIVDPVLSLTPRENQLTPDDIPATDFWFIFTWAMNGGPTMPVKTKDGETTVDAVETFPSEQAGSAEPDVDREAVN